MSRSPSVLRATTTTLASVLVLLSIVATRPALAVEPTVELLWPDGAPRALGDEPKDKPTLTIYRPEADQATGTAVAIFPGGGYHLVAMDHEGRQMAQWL